VSQADLPCSSLDQCSSPWPSLYAITERSSPRRRRPFLCTLVPPLFPFYEPCTRDGVRRYDPQILFDSIPLFSPFFSTSRIRVHSDQVCAPVAYSPFIDICPFLSIGLELGRRVRTRERCRCYFLSLARHPLGLAPHSFFLVPCLGNKSFFFTPQSLRPFGSSCASPGLPQVFWRPLLFVINSRFSWKRSCPWLVTSAFRSSLIPFPPSVFSPTTSAMAHSWETVVGGGRSL